MILPTISESSDYSYVFLTNKNNTNLHATNKNIFVCLWLETACGLVNSRLI